MIKKEELDKKLDDKPFSNLGDLIYEILHEKIITMEILPGSKINESQLADNLDLSRSPVRTAINRLADEKLINRVERKYPEVSSITPEDLLYITDARVFIESQAGYLAASIIDEDTVNELRQTAKEFEDIISHISLKDFEKCDHKFHSLIIESCGNPLIIEMYDCISDRILRYRHYLRHKLGNKELKVILQESIKAHSAICYAMDIGLSSLASDELARHSNTMKNVFTKWQ